MEYLVNETEPFNLKDPFGLYRYRNYTIYDDGVPLNKLKASEASSAHMTLTRVPNKSNYHAHRPDKQIVLRNITLLPNGHVSPEDKERLTAFFRESRWKHVQKDTKRELVDRPTDDVTFPVPGPWAPLGSGIMEARQTMTQQQGVAAGTATGVGREEKEENKGEQEHKGEERRPKAAEPLPIQPLAHSSPPSPARDAAPVAPALAHAFSSSSSSMDTTSDGPHVGLEEQEEAEPAPMLEDDEEGEAAMVGTAAAAEVRPATRTREEVLAAEGGGPAAKRARVSEP